MMEQLLDNPYFWSGVSLILLIALGFKFGRAPILAWLDGSIAKIRADLAEAARLRAEAETTLDAYRAKHAEAVREAENIVLQAERAVEDMRQSAAKELQESLARREQQAMDRIAAAEAAALAEVRRATIDLALAASEDVLRKNFAADQAAGFTDRMLSELTLPKKGAA